MLVVYLALELLRDAVREFVVVFNPLSSLRVLDGHGRNACSGQWLLSKAGNCWPGRGGGVAPERTYNGGSQLLHQLDGRFHRAAGLDPLVDQQHLHACRGRQRLSDQKTNAMIRLQVHWSLLLAWYHSDRGLNKLKSSLCSFTLLKSSLGQSLWTNITSIGKYKSRSQKTSIGENSL